MTSYKLDPNTKYSIEFLIQILRQIQIDNPDQKMIEIQVDQYQDGDVDKIELKATG